MSRTPSDAPFVIAFVNWEHDFLLRYLHQYQGHRSQLSKALGISRKCLWEKLRRHGLNGPHAELPKLDRSLADALAVHHHAFEPVALSMGWTPPSGQWSTLLEKTSAEARRAMLEEVKAKLKGIGGRFAFDGFEEQALETLEREVKP